MNAVSKTYSMTGWRIGYMTGPREFIEPISNLQSHSTSNPCSIAQKAALAALDGPQDCVKNMVDEFQKRRDFVYKAFNEIPGLKLEKPEGAFYAFVDISGHKLSDSFAMSEFLLKKPAWPSYRAEHLVTRAINSSAFPSLLPWPIFRRELRAN